MFYYLIKNKVRILFTVIFIILILVLLHGWRNSSCLSVLYEIEADSLNLKVKEFKILQQGSREAKVTYYCGCSSIETFDVTYSAVDTFNSIVDIKYQDNVYRVNKEEVINSVQESIIIDIDALFRKSKEVKEHL